MKNISKVIILLLLGTSITSFATNNVQPTDTVLKIRLDTAKKLIDANKDFSRAKRLLLAIKNANLNDVKNSQEREAARQFQLRSDREVHTLLLEIAHKQNDTPKIIEYSKYLGLPY